jgi:MFS family permease
VRTVVAGAVDGGLRNPPVRWLMLAAPFTIGVGFFAFYAFQPYLLELYGQPDAYGIAGLAAAVAALAQMTGGLLVPWVRRIVRRRTEAVIAGTVLSVVALLGIGLTGSFAIALAMLVAWCLFGAVVEPMRRSFINNLIPSEQRATVLSFDSLMGSAGGVVIQPALGRTADVAGYGAAYVAAGAIQALALPFMIMARRENAPSDPTDAEPTDADSTDAESTPSMGG